MTAPAGLSPGAVVGTVAALWRYPVKSMAGRAVTSAELSWSGLTGDRRWAFLRSGSEQSGFPWHTIRENPLMCRYVAELSDPDRPDRSAVQVRAPDGSRFAVVDPDLAARLGTDVRVMRLHRGAFDALPVSLITTRTVSALCALAAVAGEPLRFRPNLVVEPLAGLPYAEDDWVGATLAVGDAEIRVDQRDPRCTVVDVDPGTGERNAKLLKAVGRERRAQAGVYGSVVRPGTVEVGAAVRIAP